MAFKDKCDATAPMTANADTAQWLLASAYDAWTDWYLDDGQVKYGPAQPSFKQMLAKLTTGIKKVFLTTIFRQTTQRQFAQRC